MNKVKSHQKSIALLVILLLVSIIKLAEGQEQIIGNNIRIEKVADNYFVDKPYIRPVVNSIISGKQIYSYSFNTSLLEQWPAWKLQFYAETELLENTTIEAGSHPQLLVTTYWHGAIRSWEIPVHFINNTEDLRRVNRYSDDIVGNILWHVPQNTMMMKHETWNLTVEISVAYQMMVYYKLKIIPVEDFILRENINVDATATPSSPSIFKFIPPQDWEYVFIYATSNSSICARLGIRDLNVNIPFLDEIDKLDMKYTQTFTLKTGLTIRAEEFPKGFLIVFHPFPNNKDCEEYASDPDNPFRIKDVNLGVRQGMPTTDFLMPTLVPLLVINIIVVIAFLNLRWSNKYRIELISGTRDAPPIKRKLSVFKSNIYINDLIIQHPDRVVTQSRRYFWWVLISTLFYCVPVFQLITTFRDGLNDTGDFDLCYFNYYCLHMLGPLHDFNHLYSNIGYILYGVIYAVLVKYRQLSEISVYNAPQRQCGFGWWSCFVGNGTPANLDNGALTHYSLLYCLAFAQVMTGVMSAGYHDCPNKNNFQFDTIFMYTIAAFTIINIYQLRHPTYLSANFTFAALALIVVITIIGLYVTQFIAQVVFTAIHSTFLILVFPKVCFNGYVLRDNLLVHSWNDMMPIILRKFKDDLKHGRFFQLQREEWIDPHNPEIRIIHGPGRVVLPGFLMVINAASLLLIWTVLSSQNFATQVLFVCVINGSLYIIYYCVLKWCHGECRRLVWIQPGLYLFISLTLWGVGIYFFFQEVATWETTPAESRLENKDCILFGFYDHHDMWHFLSSTGLFFSSLLLLTIDDDLVDQPKSTIPVF